MSYRLTEAAVKDIRDIVNHIRYVQRSSQNAGLVAKRLKEQFAKLVRMPDLGHTRPELQDESVMVISVTGLLVIYDPNSKPLTILRVVHPARDLTRIRTR